MKWMLMEMDKFNFMTLFKLLRKKFPINIQKMKLKRPLDMLSKKKVK